LWGGGQGGEVNFKSKKNMKTLKLNRKKSVLTGAVAGMALMFAVSLLTTGCGTTTRIQPRIYYYEPQYQLMTDDCALLHIYCPDQEMYYMYYSYDLCLGDWVILPRVQYNVKATVKVEPGIYNLWPSKYTVSSSIMFNFVKINIEPGHEYYIRCSTIAAGKRKNSRRTHLELVEPQLGKYEFDKIPWKQRK
jgi:hypothetical protein